MFLTLAVVPVTSTEIVQDAAGASNRPLALIEDGASTIVPGAPGQLLVKFAGVATMSPAGRLSVNATPFSVKLALVLERVKVRLVVPFRGIVAAPKALAIVGGLMTVMLAEAVLPVSPPASVAVTLPLVLFCTPSVTPVTFTATVHVELRATVPPERLIEPDPATAVTEPEQVLVRPLGVATASPAGRLSVKARPLKEFKVLILVMVNVRLVVPPTGICVAPNALAIDGGNSTTICAVAAKPSTVAWTRSTPPLVAV